jgi:DNA-binding response OmpR family regulator
MARIIYVEGDSLVGQRVQQVLGSAGHAVDIIHHGTLTFDTIAFRQPDMVILDQACMQDLGILRALRRLPVLHCAPILILSEGGEDAVADAIAAGASGHLVKPLDPEALAARVAEMLRDQPHETSL